MKSFEERLERIETEEPITISNADGTTRTVMVKIPALRDPEDGEIYLGADATAILDKAKARLMGVLAPQELAELRRRLGLTQKGIAEILQIGEKTWSRWETGREIVSRSLNLLLRALYEGKISLPWLRAMLSQGEQMKAASSVRIYGWESGATATHQMLFSSYSESHQPVKLKVELDANAWLRLWTNTEAKCTLPVDEATCLVTPGGSDYAYIAGNYETMPLSA